MLIESEVVPMVAGLIGILDRNLSVYGDGSGTAINRASEDHCICQSLSDNMWKRDGKAVTGAEEAPSCR